MMDIATAPIADSGESFQVEPTLQMITHTVCIAHFMI